MSEKPKKTRNRDEAWQAIFAYCGFDKHDFTKAPAHLTAKQIKEACQHFKTTGAKEPRILCYQPERKDRPHIFQERGLFILPTKNGHYIILKGEGYLDIPEPKGEVKDYESDFPFELETSKIFLQGAEKKKGKKKKKNDSEMQHLDYAYAMSLIRNYIGDDTLTLTIRGRKYTPPFTFRAGASQHEINAVSVITEVDGGYEGLKQVVLMEAKPAGVSDIIIRQLYYPYRQWSQNTGKKVRSFFFTREGDVFKIWEFTFSNPDDYHSIKLVRCDAFRITSKKFNTP